MSPLIWGCIICGSSVCGRQSWRQDFRIVYSNSKSTCLSGIGFCEDPNLTQYNAPLSPDKTWRKAEDRDQQGQIIPVMWERPDNDLHGYLVHPSCWTLLEKFYYPQTVPLDRVFEICASIPFPQRYSGLSWEHGYYGIAFMDNKNFYPWEDRFDINPQDSQIHINAKTDPLNSCHTAAFLQPRSQRPPPGPMEWTQDCFARIPFEILEMIAIFLSTRDAFNLRLASRSFIRIFDSQTFWASRFFPDADRGYLFEALEKGVARDWRAIWRATVDSHRHGLQNRKRVWFLSRNLGHLLELRLCASQNVSQKTLSSHNRACIMAAADVREEPSLGKSFLFNEGCTVLSYQTTVMPPELRQIAVTIVNSGGISYISGIRLSSDKAADIRLGYVVTTNEVFFQTSSIRGFVLAMGGRGLHALQVVGDEGRSSWLGDPSLSPVTERLSDLKSLHKLEVGYDGFKLVYLALTDACPQSDNSRRVKTGNLRQTAFWYPTIPPSTLCFNDTSYTGKDPLSSTYTPFCWTHFGGARGKYLRHLIGISVTRLGPLRTIEFNYDKNETPLGNHKLGLSRTTEHSEVLDFPIDGHNGERIISIEASIEKIQDENAIPIYRDGKLESLKVVTSYHRSFHFLPHGTQAHEVKLQRIGVQCGTTITGLYATQHVEAGLVSLGLLSEVITEEEDLPPL